MWGQFPKARGGVKMFMPPMVRGGYFLESLNEKFEINS